MHAMAPTALPCAKLYLFPGRARSNSSKANPDRLNAQGHINGAVKTTLGYEITAVSVPHQSVDFCDIDQIALRALVWTIPSRPVPRDHSCGELTGRALVLIDATGFSEFGNRQLKFLPSQCPG